LAIGDTLEKAKKKFEQIILENNLGDEEVFVTVDVLSTQQAIGNPSRQDYALLEGKEVMIEAEFKGSFGQAFTSKPTTFTGCLKDVLKNPLVRSEDRAIFVASLNGVMAYLKRVSGLRHCCDEEPEECAQQIAEYIKTNYGLVKIGLIGLQPAILERLVKDFGPSHVRCTDLNRKNIGQYKYGAKIWDGKAKTNKLINWSDIILVTSSTLVNNTFDTIYDYTKRVGKKLIIFGVSGAGISALFNLERVCFSAH
jgi:uncharacterized protein (DUF4213/DUF364 family)